MASLPRTAFVHIGTPKTGTTALQSRLFASRDQLAAMGYHYLSNSANHSESISMAFWCEKDAAKLGKYRWIDTPEAFTAHRAKLRCDLEEQIARSAPRYLIISAEGLCEFHETEVQDFISFLQAHFENVRIIAYAREPQSWMTSACQQATKWLGATLDDLFQSPRTPDHAQWFQPFIDAVGRENFDLRQYGNSSEPFDVIRDFCNALGIKHLPSIDAPGGTNTSVSRQTAIMLSAINAQTPPFVDHRHNPFRAFNVVADARIPGEKFSLPSEVIALASETLESERDWLNKAFGRMAFTPPKSQHLPIKAWYSQNRQTLEGFGTMLCDRCSAAQNEKALKSYLKAQQYRLKNGVLAKELLSNAWMLATDRWTLHRIATEAVETDHPDKHTIFVKQRVMRRIEDPQPGDAPLVIGNPFQRDVPP